MTETISVLINLATRGQNEVKQAAQSLKEIDGAAKSGGASMKSMAMGIGAASAALAGMVVAGKQAWELLKDAAAIEFTQKKFDNLAASINSTGDALLGNLKAATGGMVSDLELMASASELVSLGLTKTEDETVRLASVAGQLNWNMQQVVLTMANMSTMRLDALGLSVEEVTGRAKELEAAGMAAQEAFKMAVIEAGEAKLEVIGLDEDSALGQIKQLESAWSNFVTGAKTAVLNVVIAGGGLDIIQQFNQDMGLADLKRRAAAAGVNAGDFIGASNGPRDISNITPQQLDALRQEVELAEKRNDAWVEFNNLRQQRRNEPVRPDRKNIFDDPASFGEGRARQGWADYAADYVGGLEAMGAAVDRANEIAAAVAEMNAVIAESQMSGFADIFDDFKSDWIVGDVRNLGEAWITTTDATEDQTYQLENWRKAYEGAAQDVRDLELGVAGYGMEQDKVNERLEEARKQMEHYGALIEQTEGQITSTTQKVTRNLNVNDDNVYRAIVDAAMDAGQGISYVSDLASALGLLDDSALQAAQAMGLIDFSIKMIAEGGMPADQVQQFIDDLIADLESGKTVAEIELEVQAALKPKVVGYDTSQFYEGGTGNPFVTEAPDISMGDSILGQFFGLIDAANAEGGASVMVDLDDGPARTSFDALIDSISGTVVTLQGNIIWNNTTPPIDSVSVPGSTSPSTPSNNGGGAVRPFGDDRRGDRGTAVIVNNYVDGYQVPRSSLDDITVDSIKGAMRRVGRT